MGRDRYGRGIEVYPSRILALGHDVGLLEQQPAQHDDALIGRGEMLFGMERDRPLADLRLVIVGELLMLGLGLTVFAVALVVRRARSLLAKYPTA